MRGNNEKIYVMAVKENQDPLPDLDLELSLSLPFYKSLPSSSSFRYVPSPPPSKELSLSLSLSPPYSHGFVNKRVEPLQCFCPQSVKFATIPSPFPWSSEIRATVLTMEELTRKGFHSIEGEVQCNRCSVQAIISLPLKERFDFVVHHLLHVLKIGNNFVPPEWVNPHFPSCPSCMNVNCMIPIIAKKKRDINWLFLYLGAMIGICNMDQLYYFYKHNMFYINGSKMNLLLHAYIGISKQLLPFDINV